MMGTKMVLRRWFTHRLCAWGMLLLSGPVIVASNRPNALRSEQGRPALWSPVAEDTLPAPNRTWRLKSANYRILRLDRRRLADLLARAPLAGTDQAKKADVVLELPQPDGSFATFRIEEAVVTGPGPALRCPDLHTYRGRSVDYTAGWVSFDWSRSGLYALIASSRGSINIQPYSPEDPEHYIVYDTSDWSPGPERTEGPAHLGLAAPPRSVPAQPEAPGQFSVDRIGEIAIQRGCFGCEHPYKLTFARGGTATLMTFGVLREGTVDHACTGNVRPEAFAALASLMQREGFFDLRDLYSDHQSGDAYVVITSAVVDDRQKAVQHVNRGGPPNLKAIENAVDALAREIVWTDARR